MVEICATSRLALLLLRRSSQRAGFKEADAHPFQQGASRKESRTRGKFSDLFGLEPIWHVWLELICIGCGSGELIGGVE